MTVLILLSNEVLLRVFERLQFLTCFTFSLITSLSTTSFNPTNFYVLRNLGLLSEAKSFSSSSAHSSSINRTILLSLRSNLFPSCFWASNHSLSNSSRLVSYWPSDKISPPYAIILRSSSLFPSSKSSKAGDLIDFYIMLSQSAIVIKLWRSSAIEAFPKQFLLSRLLCLLLD